MSRFPSLAGRLALLAVLSPAPLWADVTPDDVWANLQDYLNAFGGALSARVARDKDVMSISNMTYTADLPLAAGRVVMGLDGFGLKGEADGSVSFQYPAQLRYELRFAGPDGRAFEGGMTIAQTGLTTRATGAPGDVIYDYGAQRIDLLMQDIAMPGGAAQFSMSGSVQDLSGQDRVSTGAHVQLRSRYNLGAMSMTSEQVHRSESGESTRTTSSSATSQMSGATQLRLPRNGMDLMNLAAALREGLTVQSRYKSKDYFVEQDIDIGLSAPVRQVMSAATYDLDLGLNSEGLALAGTSSDIGVDMQLPEPMPVTISADLARTSGRLTMPLLESGQMAPVDIGLEVTGLRLDETVWAMFDPEQELARDAIDIELDLGGDVINRVEWLDILNVETALQTLQAPPVEPRNLSLNRLYLSAAGAELSGKGALSFDNSDLTGFGGLPRPQGLFDFEINGVKRLIDTLVSKGLIAEDQAMGARMGLTMLAVPVPGSGDEDRLKSQLEFTSQGHLLVNGSRLK